VRLAKALIFFHTLQISRSYGAFIFRIYVNTKVFPEAIDVIATGVNFQNPGRVPAAFSTDAECLYLQGEKRKNRTVAQRSCFL
jgi:hypothetical protein